MKTTEPTRPDPVHIADRARSLWQLAGSPPGRETEFAGRAESELKKELVKVSEQIPEHPAEAPVPAAPESRQPPLRLRITTMKTPPPPASP